ncbi:alpha-1,2-fucosyltransferase [Roseateles violae]|uniref:Alpha-1,2-fucosyltransferase n=1 Tax=Roseateles violae TaxID=3058042 RepID=A0ABT8DU02_9BURK|nr:alpha-1,2-fucosyltransferase [Pelomonas sp. PFR6]MDN3921775.1 alpha-1,2-fucosyltransferase [Pelomonas sp. PFR6]
MDAVIANSVATAAPPLACTLVQRLQGGIGNQLFQIAFALKLARASGSRVTFDESSFARDGFGRNSVLRRILPDAECTEIATLRGEGIRLLREPDFVVPEGGLPDRYSLPAEISHLVMDGYWQDHRFVDARDLAMLREQLRRCIEPAVASWADRIRSAVRPTAVHLRRHDYSHHGICSTDYVLQSLRWLAARRGPLDLFVFSDEPNFTSHFLKQAGIAHTLVSSGDDLADLCLMSLCGRHVISNSTYSWWGAMLSGSDDVSYPDPWSLVHQPSLHLCPPRWRRVRDALETPTPAADFRAVLDREQFRVDFQTFFSQGQLPADWTVQQRPCLDDATTTTAIDAHYVYHTAWAARRLVANPVAEHVDIGSDHRFTTIASAFQPMRFLDYRPCEVKLPGLVAGHANLLDLQIDNGSIQSLSCMHVIEHIGLGRYGDPIDFHGADTAMDALERVLAPGGLLYFVVPVGEPCVVFNAHRIFRASDIVRRFGRLELVEFSLVNDNGRFDEHVAPETADGQRYACGCFLFRKPA